MTNQINPYAGLYASKLTTAAKAVAPMAKGETLVVAMGIGAPPALLGAIAQRVRTDDLKDLKLFYMMAMK